MTEDFSKVMYIRDPVHENIRLSKLQEELLKTVEVQRLSFIHQLGTTFQCYPGAHSMRLSHALGVSYLASRIGEHLLEQMTHLSDEQKKNLLGILQAAGMLHDIGHTPWSHTLEPLYIELTGSDHMDFVADLVTGSKTMNIEGSGTIPAILEKFGIDPQDVADLICSRYTKHKWLQQLIFGEVDADMLDYLCRDFYFTGVTYGNIEMGRIISTMTVREDQIVFRNKGLEAVRDFLFARLLMYSAVYLHRKTRIVDQMLLGAARRSIIELQEIDTFWEQTDDELLSFLVSNSKDSWVRNMAWRIKYRQNLFTQVFNIDVATLTDNQRTFLDQLWLDSNTPWKIADKLAKRIAEVAGADYRNILVDLPVEAVKVSEERFGKLGIKFLNAKENEIENMSKIDPAFSEYLSKSQPNRNYLSISCCPEQRELIAAACQDVFDETIMPLFPDLE